MERGGVGESRWRVIVRRSKTVPPVVLGFVLVTVLFPALLFVALLVDLGRSADAARAVHGDPPARFPLGLPRRRDRRDARSAWSSGSSPASAAAADGWLDVDVARPAGLGGLDVRRGARSLMGLTVSVEGDDVVAPGPVIVLVRHASIVDNLLPSVFVARAHRIRLRYVLKRELLADPVPRRRRQAAAELLRAPRYRRAEVERENVRRLAQGLGPRRRRAHLPRGHALHGGAPRPGDRADRRARPGDWPTRAEASATCCRRRSGGVARDARRRARRRRRRHGPRRLRRAAADLRHLARRARRARTIRVRFARSAARARSRRRRPAAWRGSTTLGWTPTTGSRAAALPRTDRARGPRRRR